MSRTAGAVLAVAALVVASGCLGNGGEGGTATASPPVDVAELREGALEASATLDTARYHLSVTAIAESGTLRADGTGTIHRPNRRSRTDLSVSVRDGPVGRTVRAVRYVDGDVVQVRAGGRSLERTRPGLWAGGGRIGDRVAMLASDATSVSYGGTRSVRGTETHVLVLTPRDRERFVALVAEWLAASGRPYAGKLLEDGTVHDPVVRMAVAADSNRVRRVTADLELEHPVYGRVDLSVTTTYYDLNENVTVQVPAVPGRSVGVPETRSGPSYREATTRRPRSPCGPRSRRRPR